MFCVFFCRQLEIVELVIIIPSFGQAILAGIGTTAAAASSVTICFEESKLTNGANLWLMVKPQTLQTVSEIDVPSFIL